MKFTVKHLREVIDGLPDDSPVLIPGKYVELREAQIYRMPVCLKDGSANGYEYSLLNPAATIAVIIR